MSLASDTVELAVHPSRREPRRPKQASLRRAVSTAYYALFHSLVEEVSKLLAPASPQHLRPLLAWAFQHTEMVKVSRSFGSGGPLPRHHAGITPSADLRLVATTFVKLQDSRHDADYNPAARLTKTQVAVLVQEAQDAFAAWSRVRDHDEARTYLTALLAEKSWPQ